MKRIKKEIRKRKARKIAAVILAAVLVILIGEAIGSWVFWIWLFLQIK